MLLFFLILVPQQCISYQKYQEISGHSSQQSILHWVTPKIQDGCQHDLNSVENVQITPNMDQNGAYLGHVGEKFRIFYGCIMKVD